MRPIVLLWLLLLGLAAPAGAALLRAGAPLSAPFAEALGRAALQARGAAGEFQIVVDQPALPLGNAATLATEATLEPFQYHPTAGGFHGALMGTFEERERFRLPIFGRAQAVLRVPALRLPVTPDEVITAADLTRVQVHAQVPPAGLAEPADIVDAQARRRLAAHRMLTERAPGPPLLVRRGRPVELIYARPGLYVTTLGVAQENGALGDLVRVVNPESRRELQGVVSGPDEVAFGAAAARAR